MSRIKNNYISIRETKKKMLDKLEELQKELVIVEGKIEDTKKDFDTPFANKFRIRANELIKEEMKTIDETLIPYVNNLEEVSNIYEKAYNELNGSING